MLWKPCEAIFSPPVVPDAVLAGNDTTAIGVIKYAKQHGISIPSELNPGRNLITLTLPIELVQRKSSETVGKSGYCSLYWIQGQF